MSGHKVNKSVTLKSKFIILILLTVGCIKDRNLSQPQTIETPPNLIINEIAPNETPDWVEIANPSNQTILLKGGEWFFSDDTTQPTKVTLKKDIIIKGGSYLIIQCTTQPTTDTSIVTCEFSLSSTNGESFGIYSTHNNQITTINEVQFPGGINQGNSFARHPDITGPFQVSSVQSKGSKNP